MAQMGQQYQTAQQYQYPQQHQQNQNSSQYAAAQHYQQQQQQQQYSYAANQQNSQQYPHGYQQQNYQQYQPQQYNAHSQNQQYSQQYPNQHNQQYAQQYSQQYPQQYQQYTEQSQQYPQQAQQYSQQTQQYPQQTQQYPQQSQQYSQPQQQYTQQSQQHQQYSSQQQSPQYPQYSQYPQQQQGNNPNHSTTQDQSYAYPYQAQNQQNFVQPALPGQETCYNCGAPNHMAQNCPEPRREVPAGLIKRQKRQYYPKNQHGYNGAMSASNSQQQAYNQSAFAQNQSYSPATPNSARSSFSQQWQSGLYQQQGHVQQQQQQQQLFQQDQQAVQQSPYQSQSSPQNYPSYSTPVTPGMNSQFDAIHHGQTAAPQDQHSNANGPAHFAHNGSMPPADNQPDAILDGQKAQAETEEDSANMDDEPEDDDLASLDVPDLPRTTEQYGEAVIRPVGRALPSNSIVADAISPLPAPAVDGRCQSKYYENVGKILEMQEIRVSPYWKDVQDDTIFRPIVDEGKTKSVDECLEKVQQRLKPQSEEEILHKSRSESRSLAPRSAEAIGMAESLETLERALAEAKAKQAEMIRNRKRMKQRRESDAQHNQSENVAKSPVVKKEHQSPPFSASPNESAVESRSTEDVLASLGVTGPSKPGTAVAGRGHQRSSNTMSPHYPKQQHQQHQGMNGHAQGSPPSKLYAQHFPLAQEIQTPTYSDGSNVHSPDSSRRLYTNGTNGNGPYSYSAEDSTMSPTQYQSERSQSHKRSYEQREESSSSEEGSSPRRQEDDILPKHKKRQPQVAAAYSRRW